MGGAAESVGERFTNWLQQEYDETPLFVRIPVACLCVLPFLLLGVFCIWRHKGPARRRRPESRDDEEDYIEVSQYEDRGFDMDQWNRREGSMFLTPEHTIAYRQEHVPPPAEWSWPDSRTALTTSSSLARTQTQPGGRI